MSMAIASSLSRASSTSSIDSNHDRERFSRAQSVRLHDTPANPTPPPSRRTRKRFTNAQLTMLESLFHRNSHPSREEREAVAAAGGMEVKSVTIWFQNKRQTERKVALHNAGGSNSNPPNPQPNISTSNASSNTHSHAPSNATSAPHNASSSSSRRATHQHSQHIAHSSPFPPSAIISTSPSTSRPSLDHVASRSEMRYSMTPRTPTRRHHHHHHHHSHPRNNDDNVTNYTTSNVHPKSGSASARNSRSHVTTSSSSIWDHMPSSPPALQPSSPSSHHVIPPKSNRSARRTLEWACEAARLENTDDDEDEEAYYDNAEDQQIPRRGHEHSPRLSDKRSSHQKRRHAHQQQQSQEQQRALGIKTGSTRDSRNIRQQTLTRGAHAHAPDLDEVAGRASAISVAELTEDEADEAITPPSTLGKDDSRWSNPPAGKTKSLDSGRTMSLISSSLDGPSTAPTTISGSMSGSGRMSMLADSHSQGVVIVEPPGSGPMESGNRDGTPLSLQQKPIMKDLEELGLEAYADLEPDEDVMRAALALCRLGRRK